MRELVEEIEEAAVHVGLFPSQVWEMTLAEILEVVEVRAERMKAETDLSNYRAGLICSVLANLQRDPRKRQNPYTPGDFVHLPGKKEKVKTPMSDQEMLNQATVLNKILGGEVV